jgi:hypothetical protein
MDYLPNGSVQDHLKDIITEDGEEIWISEVKKYIK